MEAWIGLIGVAVGAVITGLISYFVTGKQLAHAKEVQEMNLQAEDRRQRENLWFETMTGPFLRHRRECIERAVEILSSSERIEPDGELAEELRRLDPYLPREVQEMLRIWWEMGGSTVMCGGDPHGPDMRQQRYIIAGVAIHHLIISMSSGMGRRFAESGEAPRMDEFWSPWLSKDGDEETSSSESDDAPSSESPTAPL